MLFSLVPVVITQGQLTLQHTYYPVLTLLLQLLHILLTKYPVPFLYHSTTQHHPTLQLAQQRLPRQHLQLSTEIQHPLPRERLPLIPRRPLLLQQPSHSLKNTPVEDSYRLPSLIFPIIVLLGGLPLLVVVLLPINKGLV